ncbi:MAG TPA: DUF664 domain-containing protein [Actinophytocola sp.]|jgi:uncharacterized damage-inducible protein DinB|nr:DUF664 domain-containing protein [Actinophytocola sp.]
MDFPEPSDPTTSRDEVFLRYLDFFRSRVIDKARTLPPAEVHESRLPSGWTPAELLKHLRHMERRWIEWRFLGGSVPDPWADRKDDRWYAPEPLPDLVAALESQAERTREVVSSTPLSTVGIPGPGWSAPATLERVLFHMLQEYARHLGHLDIVAELAAGEVGE